MTQNHIMAGYTMIDGKICIDEGKAKTVKGIFHDYLAGASTYTLAKELTETGFLNANGKSSWNHGSVGMILENAKYLGDSLYPRLIEPEIFEQVKERRKEICSRLGRTAQPNSMKNQDVFSGRIKCGECGEIFRKYIKNCGKPWEESGWKCKKQQIYRNKIYCCCGTVTDDQIREAFIAAANQIISRTRILDRKEKEEPNRTSWEFKELDQRIKELEADKGNSPKELYELIFKRAEAFYATAEVRDYEHNTEKMKQAFSEIDTLTEFDDELFLATVRHLTVYAGRRLTFEFINGLTIDGTY